MERGPLDTLVLVRHGRTAWNRERRFRGRTDLPLDAVGREQAEAAAAFVASRFPPVALLASPLRRAVDTAAPLARRTGVDAVTDDGLLAMRFGAWEGRSAGEVEALWPAEYRRWVDDPAGVRPPGGETLAEVRTRAAAAARAALDAPPRPPGGPGGPAADALVIVAHTVVNRMIALDLLGMESAHFWKLAQRPCGVSVLRRLRSRWVIDLWNATDHLPGHLEDGLDA